MDLPNCSSFTVDIPLALPIWLGILTRSGLLLQLLKTTFYKFGDRVRPCTLQIMWLWICRNLSRGISEERFRLEIVGGTARLYLYSAASRDESGQYDSSIEPMYPSPATDERRIKIKPAPPRPLGGRIEFIQGGLAI